MTGLTLPASTAAALPGKVAAPSVLALGTAADGAPGVPSLAAFLDLMIGNTEVAPKGGQPGDGRQDDAATGKALPQKPEEKGDPALAWLLSVAPIALPPLDPAKLAPVASGKAPSPIVAADSAVPALAAASAPAPAPTPLPLPLLAADAPQPPAATDSAPTAPLPNAQPVVDPKALAPTAPIAVDAAAAATIAVPAAPGDTAKALPADGPAPARPDTQPIRVAVPAAAPVPLAARLPANAPMPALFALAMAPERDTRNDADAGPTGGIAAAATLLSPTDAAQLIAKPGGAQGQALDMGRQDWPQKMIDRIEALRDDANANDTSIRLKPDALGRVDVSLRTHADGGVSVHFAAEQPATRTLIADAAPQLNAAAEARGIRLAGTSVDLSGSGMAGGDRPRAQFELRQNSSNHLADGGDEIEAAAGGRIA
jgi:flagellar hook-length control protein FliK